MKQYWSIERGQLVSIPENSSVEETKMKDHSKATRSAFIFGTCMIFLSWVGFVFFIIYIFSVHKLAKSRFEKKIFESDLVKNKLSIPEVQKTLAELASL